MHVHLGGSGAHRTTAAASSTRPQHGRTAAAAASAAAAARCSRGRRSAAAGGCCGGAASCGGGLAAQPMSDTRHQHMSPVAAPTSKHLHLIVTHPFTTQRFGIFHCGVVTGVFKDTCHLPQVKASSAQTRQRVRRDAVKMFRRWRCSWAHVLMSGVAHRLSREATITARCAAAATSRRCRSAAA